LYAWISVSACQVVSDEFFVATLLILPGVGPESTVTTGTVVSSVIESVAVDDSFHTSSRSRQVSVFEPSPVESRTAIDALSVFHADAPSVA
jgi:hypothetical protein